jgi:hypothetical protein
MLVIPIGLDELIRLLIQIGERCDLDPDLLKHRLSNRPHQARLFIVPGIACGQRPEREQQI